jgi:dynein heavy chain
VDDDESGKPRLRVKIDDIAKSVFYRCFNSYIETNPDLPKIKYIAPIYEIAKIQSLCCILDALLKEEENNIKQLSEEHQRTAYEALFVFAGMWAYGGSVGGGQDDEKDQKDFSSLWKAASKIKFPEQG